MHNPDYNHPVTVSYIITICAMVNEEGSETEVEGSSWEDRLAAAVKGAEADLQDEVERQLVVYYNVDAEVSSEMRRVQYIEAEVEVTNE